MQRRVNPAGEEDVEVLEIGSPPLYDGWAGGHSVSDERGLLGSSPPQSTLDPKCFTAQ